MADRESASSSPQVAQMTPGYAGELQQQRDDERARGLRLILSPALAVADRSRTQ
jgi:hypothetical protein